ncbi:sugar phosphate isomerase/epimerase family protein [Fervidibacillus halotolerans]|uniref:Sugar phosphate isomerase/epimerase n=1 Tax=Fervidibacillus halotolerans TaxID=2980027 RepID=A0A9E8RYZ2_9BACI|nr:sugar phosphate isomerase/epimerase family protein [Fervidibacillus halotolerans]WAA12768.1 sugar phosphate isomerase/epimerase [Fervidibacillus halotolerans]
MINLRFASTLAWAFPIDQVIRMASECHFVGVEVWAEHVWKYETNTKTIREVKEETNMLLTMHAASWDLNISALNNGIRKQSVQEIIRSIELASQIGADNITFHPGKLTISNSERSIHEALLFESLEELARKAKQEGVTLSLEMMEREKKEFIHHPKALKKVIDPFYPQIQSTFDVAHIPLHENIFSIWKGMPTVNKIHISDATDEKLHLPLGDGDIHFETLMKFLSFESIPVIIEGFDDSNDLNVLKKNIQFIQRNKADLKEVVG